MTDIYIPEGQKSMYKSLFRQFAAMAAVLFFSFSLKAAADTAGETLVITGVTSFSNWYAGNQISEVGDWMLMK